MESMLFGIAIGSFICAVICAIIAIIIHKTQGVHNAINFLRNKKVAPTSHSVSRKKPSSKKGNAKHEVSKLTKCARDVVRSESASTADVPSDAINGNKKSTYTSTLFQESAPVMQRQGHEETECPTTLLQEETEAPTTILQQDTENPTTLLEDSTENPTSLLEVEGDTERPTTLLTEEDTERPTSVSPTNDVVTGNVLENEPESAFRFVITQSEIVIHTSERI